MTEPRPAPYPATTRAKGWRFELDLEQVMQSDTWALAKPDVRPWLLMLWTTAWQQVPCGSMPGDDELIVARLGIDHDVFARCKRVLLRGWWLADDGRLYHPTITQRVLDMLAHRTSGTHRRYRSLVSQRDGDVCRYCGVSDTPLTLDHVIPRSRGGSDSPMNLVLACRPCNSSKGARTPAEWGRSA